MGIEPILLPLPSTGGANASEGTVDHWRESPDAVSPAGNAHVCQWLSSLLVPFKAMSQVAQAGFSNSGSTWNLWTNKFLPEHVPRKKEKKEKKNYAPRGPGGVD